MAYWSSKVRKKKKYICVSLFSRYEVRFFLTGKAHGKT